MTRELNPFERWMVRSNIENAKTDGAETVVATLRANGYDRVADAVTAQLGVDGPSVAAPVGKWWLTYHDGAVWPCEVLRPALLDRWTVRPVSPAPDAGTERTEPRRRILDSAGNHPRVVTP